MDPLLTHPDRRTFEDMTATAALHIAPLQLSVRKHAGAPLEPQKRLRIGVQISLRSTATSSVVLSADNARALARAILAHVGEK